MSKRPISKSIPHTEHTTCSECGIEGKYHGELFEADGYAMVYCHNCQQDFDVQIPFRFE